MKSRHTTPFERRQKNILEKIVQLNEKVIKGQLKKIVRGSVEETLDELLEAEAEKLTQAAGYERNEQRQGYRSGHYNRNLSIASGDVVLKILSSREAPLRLASLSGIVAGRAVWKRPSLKCTWQVCIRPAHGGHHRGPMGASRSLPPPSVS